MSKLAEEKQILNEETQSSNPTNQEESVESVFAEEELEVNEPTPPDQEKNVNVTEVKLKELEKKLEEMENRYLRLQADFDNSRRRSRLDLEAAQKYRAQSLITELLPALDNFERALKVESDHEETQSLLQGMEMIYRALVEALKKEGVEVIEAVGKEFDPHLHQAVMQVSEEGFDSNIIVDEFQRGYLLKDRVIRPSMVKVNQ